MVLIQKNHAVVVRKLLEHLVDDFARGTHPLEAGWINSNGPEVDYLFELGLAEKDQRGTRFRLDKVKDIKLTKWDESVDELITVCSDIAKAVKVEQLIAKIVDNFSDSTELQATIFLLGWWRMLETSEFPVYVDEVLQATLSPDKWYRHPKLLLNLLFQ